MSDQWYYRYEDRCYAGCSIADWGGEEYYTIGPVLRLLTFKLVKKTPKGAWIERDYGVDSLSGDRRWVSDTSRKRYALPTKEQALESYRRRKARQIGIYSARLRTAQRALKLADMEDVGQPPQACQP